MYIYKRRNRYSKKRRMRGGNAAKQLFNNLPGVIKTIKNDGTFTHGRKRIEKLMRQKIARKLKQKGGVTKVYMR